MSDQLPLDTGGLHPLGPENYYETKCSSIDEGRELVLRAYSGHVVTIVSDSFGKGEYGAEVDLA